MHLTTLARFKRAPALLLLLGLLAGCYRSADPPATQTVVETPPPPPVTEVVVASPGPEFYYVDGYWGWSGGARIWIGGHWERPPHARAVWVHPRWEHRGHGYVFIQGYWH